MSSKMKSTILNLLIVSEMAGFVRDQQNFILIISTHLLFGLPIAKDGKAAVAPVKMLFLKV